MKNFKRMISLLLVCAFVFSAAACGGGSTATDTTTSSADGEIDIDTVDFSQYEYISIEEYRDKIMELLKKSTEELTEEERAIIEAYINIV